ncbi:MAG: Beta-lactamase-like protein [Rhodocyclaceae bacterium]|nr:Beta-lactamase-like protein [Rhodocyclaceae bacterium]
MYYPHAHPPAAAVPLAVAPGVFWLRMSLPFQLDHINLWLLRDGDGWAIIDTGFPNDEARGIWERVLADLEGPVTKLVVTHFHPDHLGLATWLMERTGAPLYMTTGEFLTAHAVWNEIGGHGARFMVEQFRQHGLQQDYLSKYEKRGSGYRQAVPALPEHYHRLMAGDELQIDGRGWRILIGHGHSPEHAALYCQELGVLISGDMLLPKISTNISVFAATPDADVLGWYLDSLSEMADAIPGQTLILPSHGLPFTGVQARVEGLRAHHADRLRALEEVCEAPQSAAGVLGTLFPRALDTHQMMFAMGEAIAHLNHLEKAGRLSRIFGADGVIRFMRTINPTAVH